MSDNCHNCGSNDWSNKKGYECPHCGFKQVEAKDLPEATLVFCVGCAVHYLDVCPIHDKSKLIPIKVQVPNATEK
jgi:hypothetical protein